MTEHARSEFLPTRESLLGRLKDLGDDDSWKDFFDTYGKLIYATAVKAGLTETEAQDVLQETLLSITKSMQVFKYDPLKGSFKNYLLRLTNWRINDQFRKRRPMSAAGRGGADETDGSDPIEKIPDPNSYDTTNFWEEEWNQNLFAVAVERIKARFDPKQYQIFELSVFQDWPVKKIAATLKINPGRVYLAKHRIALALRAEVKALERKVPAFLLHAKCPE